MINLEIPTNYTFSPSEGTPHLTINHDVAADIDSTNAFEGPEKLLEVWFAPNSKSLPPGVKENGLKSVASETWVGMLDMVNCKILSVLEAEHMDAYLLSESSMFVFPHKLILKTCGTTTLLLGLHRLLRIAAEHAGFPFHNAASMGDIHAAATPYRVFYSRKNFLFPHKQQGPHRSWKQEVKYLDDMFEGGSAYMVGKMNGDHWYLYITSPSMSLTPPRTPDGEKAAASPTSTFRIPTGLTSAFNGGLEGNDETLEILMTDLDPENAKKFYLEHASAVASTRLSEQVQEARQMAIDSFGDLSGSTATLKTTSTIDSVFDDAVDVFSNGSDSDLHDTHTPLSEQADTECLTTEGHALGTVVSDACGLSDVYPTSKYPDARIDAYLFTPCGFSANGIIPAPQNQEIDENAKSTHYFTVHVTPEPICSFASFETNVPGGQNGRETSEIIDHVVRIFKPGRFSVTLFEAKAVQAYDNDEIPTGIGRSKRMEKIPGYRRVDRIVHDFDDYELIFRYYEREDWVGGSGPRVGEDL
ncbi:S-adenosylmethionine decarboxylase proenzyme [Daldinia childiae]|uniref:S-adenosylmethionine decarboxylase proenzyme n=1 Tax=Daldinia childiae TaxID=326645 RepID=UPI00144567E4|nr:S-adenosylmethionine decarboxylase proenzyme [Daldinia childiae]KAF3069118.1 S-adenosylmethionine decarboxylase proenzyme [Daldinia childiae]